MPTYKRQWNEKVYLKRLAEGRGSGEFADYLPWLYVTDVTSRGRSTRIKGIKSGRTHHFLSWNENAFFFILDSSPRVIDIREQFPFLYIQDTLRTAQKAHIAHPRDNVSRYPYVLTTDFFIVTDKGAMARSVKEKKELSKPRFLEKLELERRYWLERGVDWKLVTEDQIDFQKARNIKWIRRGNELEKLVPDPAERELATKHFLNLYRETILPVNYIACDVERLFGYKPGMAFIP